MPAFTNLPTRTKLIAGFGLVIVLLIAIVLVGLFSLNAVRDGERGVAKIMEIRNAFNGQRAALLHAASMGENIEALMKEVAEYSVANTTNLKWLEVQYRRDAELGSLVEKMTEVRSEYVRVREEQVIPAIRARKKDEAMALIAGEQAERFLQFRGLAREFTDRLEKGAVARLKQTQWIFGLLGGGAVLAAMVLVVSLSRSLADPLQRMTSLAKQISEGELNGELEDTTRGDEVGVLAQTFQRMSRSLTVLAGRARQITEGDLTAQIKPRSERDVLGNAFANMTTELRRIMQELLDAVNVLASSASEIMASTTQLAASAAETATAVTETTATVEEVKQTSRISSEKAKYVADEAQKSANVAVRGRTAVEQTVAGMGSIRQQMDAVAESILSLSAQSQAIGEIIATVDDLAAQSKLLAVNASIEAAKAGEEGKGFAVVAQEVRSLAEQSKQATLQVRTILNDIQKATGRAVLATEQGGKAVEAGMHQSTASGDSIRELAENISGAAQAATQIAATSQQQFVGMDQVAMAMENIKTASTQTVASTKQVETAAQQLHQLGQKLKQLVERFKV